jgi:hypothetical protein
MISFDEIAPGHIYIRLCDEFETREAATFEKVLLGRAATAQRLTILFDWSKLSNWKLEHPRRDVTPTWDKTARAIERIAILHHRRWNRHAALFAAYFRSGGAQVNSYTPTEREQACAWLHWSLPIINP